MNVEKELKAITQRLKRLENPEHRQTVIKAQKEIKDNQMSLDALKNENKTLKKQLANLLREQGKKGKSIQQAELEKLETKVHQLRLTHDDLKHQVKVTLKEIKLKQDRLKDIRRETKPILTDNSPLTRQIRVLENRLDKAMIKYNEAQSIKKTYEAILKRLKEERIGFDNQLQAIERTLKAKQNDYQELRNMYREANYLKELAKSELQEAKQQFEETKKQKEKELQEKKNYVQLRVDMTQKIRSRAATRKKLELSAKGRLDGDQQKKLKTASIAQIFQGATNDNKIAQEYEKLNKLEAKWRKVKEVTGVNDANEVIQKFLSSTDTLKNLQQSTKEAQGRIDELNKKKASLKAKLEDLKYSQNNGLGSRRIVDEYVQQLTEAESNAERNKQKYERVAKILINVKAGVEHLADKLHSADPSFEVPKQETQTDQEFISGLLSVCEEKLKDIVDGLDKQQLEDLDEDDEDADLKVSFKFDPDAYKVSDNNLRINLQIDSDEEDLEDLEDEEEEDVLDRAQVKKLSVLAIEKNNKKKKSLKK